MTKQQRITVKVFAVFGLAFLVHRLAKAKTPPKGEVFIGPVTVTSTGTMHEGDAELARLNALIEKARGLIYSSVEAEEPDVRPSTVDQLILTSILKEVETAAYPAIPNTLSPEQKQGYAWQAERLRQEIQTAMNAPSA